jgi:hypothetical protein
MKSGRKVEACVFDGLPCDKPFCCDCGGILCGGLVYFDTHPEEAEFVRASTCLRFGLKG